MSPARVAPGAQVAPHAGAAVRTIALREAGPDVHDKVAVDLCSGAFGPSQPLVEAAARDTERLAHLVRSPHPSVLRDEAELHRWSLAKEAMAFFRMSRSALVFASSRRKWAISASSGFILPRPGNDCAASALNSRTHLPKTFSCTSRSLAAWATDTPRSVTSRTASSLNSRLNNRRFPTGHLRVDHHA